MVSLDKLYVTPDEIRDWLGVGEDELPDTLLVGLIAEKCEYVDNITDSTFNGRIKKAREIHDLGKWKAGFWWGAGIEITLAKRYIRAFEHIFVVWATVWEDWVQTRKEGRNIGDWWADYDMGVVYLKGLAIHQGGREIIIEYYYGTDELPYEIKDLTRLLVIRDLIWRDRYAFTIPDGASLSLDYNSLLDRIEERIHMLEELYRGVKVGSAVVRELGEFDEPPDIVKCCGANAWESGRYGQSLEPYTDLGNT